MGYGEVGGGGSLQWQMTHNNRKKAGGLPVHVPPIAGKPPQQGEAIDPDVNDGTDLFILIKRGVDNPGRRESDTRQGEPREPR
jgi:hypothetical protein